MNRGGLAMSKLMDAVRANRTVILMTFKIFWILIFVLEMTANRSGAGIPQFVYVNF